MKFFAYKLLDFIWATMVFVGIGGSVVLCISGVVLFVWWLDTVIHHIIGG